MAKGKPNRLARVLGATLGVLVLLAAIVAGGLALCYQVLFPKPYHPIVSKYAQEFGVDENLIYSVMKCESSFDPSATSSVPAMGLMQITEEAICSTNSTTNKWPCPLITPVGGSPING